MSSAELPTYPPEKEKETGVVLKHADSNDADEALKIIQAGETIILTPQDEKRLLRKIDLHIMPLLCLVYGLNYLDKTSISYASIMGFKVGLIPLIYSTEPKVVTEFL
jgi:ACS family allantoate permease-like MFS transporter